MTLIVDKARKAFFDNLAANGPDIYDLGTHVPEAERWAKKLIKMNPSADEEIVLLGVWMHDFGHYPLTKEDHAVIGEKKAKDFLLSQGYSKERTELVVHAVRSHRCKDVLPNTLEAKILACADSASHFTFPPYFDILIRKMRKETTYNPLEKLDRDYRDLAAFSEIKKELTPIYKLYKELIERLEKI